MTIPLFRIIFDFFQCQSLKGYIVPWMRQCSGHWSVWRFRMIIMTVNSLTHVMLVVHPVCLFVFGPLGSMTPRMTKITRSWVFILGLQRFHHLVSVGLHLIGSGKNTLEKNIFFVLRFRRRWQGKLPKRSWKKNFRKFD